MAQFHFVEDYEKHVTNLIANYPIDEAMSLAVGGGYEEIGALLAEILIQNGLRNGMTLVDLGCGSGRAAKAISNRVKIDYLGTDIVKRLLDYAATVTPKHYQYKCHQNLSIPAETASTDMICAFSLFTHLLHEETYLYLEDAYRVLKPDGRLVMSFLEFASPPSWDVFEVNINSKRENEQLHLNMFIERNAIDLWCSHLGFERISFVDGADPCWMGHALGQSVAVLRKQG